MRNLPRTDANGIAAQAVQSVVNGEAIDAIDAIANLEVLDYFTNRPELAD